MNCAAEDDLDQDLHGGRGGRWLSRRTGGGERAVEYSAEARG